LGLIRKVRPFILRAPVPTGLAYDVPILHLL